MTRHEMLITVLQMILQLAVIAGRIADNPEGKAHGQQLEEHMDHWISEEIGPQV